MEHNDAFVKRIASIVDIPVSRLLTWKSIANVSLSVNEEGLSINYDKLQKLKHVLISDQSDFNTSPRRKNCSTSSMTPNHTRTAQFRCRDKPCTFEVLQIISALNMKHAIKPNTTNITLDEELLFDLITTFLMAGHCIGANPLAPSQQYDCWCANLKDTTRCRVTLDEEDCTHDICDDNQH
eukprot:c454_g1_i1.p1 GENE.c454_g1_i1~~c454_g1_i1.p1  ORF type:complete len:181 (-),score=41.68 c454_g1_i1:843-1385(-)